jgi:VanZ family protein
VDGRDRPGHDDEDLPMAIANRSKWLRPLAVAMLVAIAVATLVPAGWQIRLGLHWLVEHFLAYFTVTLIICLAWPRPMVVAMVLVPLAILLETAQGLTPDRVPDVATALFAATGVAVAALLAELITRLRGRGQNGAATGPSP